MTKQEYLRRKKQIDRPNILGLKRSDVIAGARLIGLSLFSLATVGWTLAGVWFLWVIFGA